MREISRKYSVLFSEVWGSEEGGDPVAARAECEASVPQDGVSGMWAHGATSRVQP